MNKKLVLGGLGLLSVTSAFAGVTFELGYGDANFASLNSAAVGTMLPTDRPVTIPILNQTFTVQIWATYEGTADLAAIGGILFVGTDLMKVGNHTTDIAGLMSQGKKRMLQPAAEFTNPAKGFAGFNSKNEPKNLDLTFLKNTVRSEWGEDVRDRSVGVNGPFGFGVGNNATIKPGVPFRLADLAITNRRLSDSIFGDDAGENGLTLNVVRNAGTGTNFLGGYTDPHYPVDTKRYQVYAAVPEPMTLGALALGLAAVARRRNRR